MGHRDSRTRNPTNFQTDYSQSFVPIAAKRSSSTSRGKAPTAVTGAEIMIIAEDRHIPKTKHTHTLDVLKRVFADDEQQNPIAGGQVRTEELTQSDISSLEQADRMLDQREKLRQNAMSYGMPSENPSAKIPAEPGQSGSSGVYRTQTGPITLDDMERILGSVYAEKQACGCSHPCQQPCACTTKDQKGYLFKGTVRQYDKLLTAPEHVLRENGLTTEQVLEAKQLRLELDAARKQWEAENQGKFVPKEFGLQSLNIPEMAESVARDCVCPAKTDKTLQCRCLVR